MVSCICTVMKDEHAYLDEWIKHHLAIGINHIFIFEDVNSKSHSSITDNYDDAVSLMSIADVFDGGKDEVMNLRNENRYYQKYFFIHGIKYIQSMNLYDWCFCIDNDEFIVFEKEDDTLDNIFAIYKDYDAFMLQWMCYGACGHITKPDYGDNGLMGTYTEPSKGQLNSSDIGFTKTCYNLRTFDEKFFWNVHQPSDLCKWCKTDLRQFRLRPIYNNIYIKHYMTKSWEEYVYKLKVRGDILDKNRLYDDFFDLNPELNDRREELEKMAENIGSTDNMDYLLERREKCWWFK